MIEPESLLKNACPLVHPADYTVRTRIGSIQLYRQNRLWVGDTRFYVPHTARESILSRERILEAAERDSSLQAQWLYAVSQPCPQALILWVNLFVWTFQQQEIDAKGHQAGMVGKKVPFVTWPTQDKGLAELFYAITTGYDWCFDKSRQMGATWLISVVFTWFMIFFQGMHFDVISQTEELVDNPGDPLSIFWKIDYLVDSLPEWMKPNINRTRLKILNLDLGSSIVGRSTTSKKGRGGARNAVLFDEAALIDVLEQLWTGYGQSCASRGANSTPYGAGYFSKITRMPSVQKIILPWWEHPKKGRDRYIETDPDTRDQFVCSPFYVDQCRRESPDPDRWWMARKSRRISQELDLDHTGSGELVFSYQTIARQLSMVPAHPEYIGELRWHGEKGTRLPALKRGDVSLLDFEDTRKGRWELWLELFEDGLGHWRPHQERTYVFGIDVAQGVGASESVISVYNVEEARKCAQFCSSATSPVSLAILACQAGYWFGGDKRYALIAHETNGYGKSFTKAMIRLGYPWLFQERMDEKKKKSKAPSYGWTSTRHAKRTLFDQLNDAMTRGEFENPSRKALDQAAEIVNYQGGGIGPAMLAVETEEGRVLHADCVTADAVAWYAAQRLSFAKPKEGEPRRGSAAWRRQNINVMRNADHLEAE